MPNQFYMRGMRTACNTVKVAMAPALKEFMQRAAIGASIDAAVGAAIAPRPEDRARMAALSALATIPVSAAEHIPDAFRYLKETKPGFAALMKRIRL